MKTETTRRTFLSGIVAGLAALAAAETTVVPPPVKPAADPSTTKGPEESNELRHQVFG